MQTKYRRTRALLGAAVAAGLATPADAAPRSDHALRTSSYVGGSYVDYAEAVAVDAAGNLYVTGYTGSEDFPTSDGAAQTEFTGGDETVPYDAFVTKVDPTGSEVVYSTYIGGDAIDMALDITVDATGAAYVIGKTSSSDFPTTPGALDNRARSADNVFLTKIAPDGRSFAYSAILGPGEGTGVDVDDEGRAYVTGTTRGSSYPATAGALQPQPSGNGDSFVSEVTAAGDGFVYSTFLGGTEVERSGDVGIDPTGAAVVSGVTSSEDFPATPGAFQQSPGDDSPAVMDAYVTKLAPGGETAVYSTYLGGDDFEWQVGVDADASGNAFVAGGTSSSDFPTTRGAFQTEKKSRRRGEDAFVVKLDPSGDVRYSTLLGGSAADGATSVAVADRGTVYVAGSTRSNDFPTTPGALKRKSGDNTDAFLTRVARSGRSIVYSTTYGGWSQYELGLDVAVAAGRIGLAGPTYGEELPLAGKPFQPEYAGNADAYVASFSPTPARGTNLVRAGFDDPRLRLGLGDTVQWHFKSNARRSVEDASGLGLFDSRRRGREYHYAFSFFAAGRFVAVDSATKDRQRIPVRTRALSTPEGIRLAWATERREGYVFDVQAKPPGASSFETVHEGTPATDAMYEPATDGRYVFRARIRSAEGRAASGWSPPVAVEV